MFWWRRYAPPYFLPPQFPSSPEEELRMLEDYKRELEREIENLREELKSVEEEIDRLKKEMESGERRPEVTAPTPPYMPPQYWMPFGYGYGYGWGRGRGGMGWGRGGMGPMPPAAGPQQAPMQPPPPGVKRVAASVDDNNGLNSRISIRFGRAPFIAFIDIADNEVKSVQILPNQAAAAPMGAGISTAQFIISSGATEVIGTQFGPNVSMAFEQANLRVHTVEPGIPLSEALRKAGLLR